MSKYKGLPLHSGNPRVAATMERKYSFPTLGRRGILPLQYMVTNKVYKPWIDKEVWKILFSDFWDKLG